MVGLSFLGPPSFHEIISHIMTLDLLEVICEIIVQKEGGHGNEARIEIGVDNCPEHIHLLMNVPGIS